jgi:hypothetical protein
LHDCDLLAAGLLAAITAASPVLTALIQPTQQQQQQQQGGKGTSCAAMLSVSVLRVWDRSVCILLDEKAPVPASSIVAVSGLVRATLMARPASSSSSSSSSSSITHATGAGSSNSNSSSSIRDSSSNAASGGALKGADASFAGHLQRMKANYPTMEQLKFAAGAAFTLAIAAERSEESASNSLGLILVQDSTAAANIGWVRDVNIAWMVQQQQQLSRAQASTSSTSSTSSSSRGQQALGRVPPWHVQFLSAVGVPAWRAGWRSISDAPQRMFKQLHILQCTGQMLQTIATLFRFPTAGGGQGSSSSGAAGLQQRFFEELLPPRETLLLLLLEVILLHPLSTTMLLCHQIMQGLWGRMQATDAQQTAGTMLQPVLHLLGPAVMQQLDAAGSSSSTAAAGSSSSSSSSSSGDDATLDDSSQDFARWYAKLAEQLVAAGASPLCGCVARRSKVITGTLACLWQRNSQMPADAFGVVVQHT